MQTPRHADEDGQETKEKFTLTLVFRAKGAIWSETKLKSAVENAYGHWIKHKKEFSELKNAKQYADEAMRFLNSISEGKLFKVRKNGDTVVYDPASNVFGIKNADGVPKTMFKPDASQHGFPTNLDYFYAQ